MVVLRCAGEVSGRGGCPVGVYSTLVKRSNLSTVSTLSLVSLRSSRVRGGCARARSAAHDWRKGRFGSEGQRNRVELMTQHVEQSFVEGKTRPTCRGGALSLRLAVAGDCDRLYGCLCNVLSRNVECGSVRYSAASRHSHIHPPPPTMISCKARRRRSQLLIDGPDAAAAASFGSPNPRGMRSSPVSI